MLQYYLRLSTLINLQQRESKDHGDVPKENPFVQRCNCLVKDVELARIKIDQESRKIDGVCCNLKLEFDLKKHPGFKCKVYRRIRWEKDDKKRKVYDWKIKVM